MYHFSYKWEQLQHTVEVVPIYKKNDTKDKSNYRPIDNWQLLKFFERNSAKNIPNSLITLVGMWSDFEAFFEFTFLIMKRSDFVCANILENESFIVFFHLLLNSYYAWMTLKFYDDVINIIIIYIIIILAKRSDT